MFSDLIADGELFGPERVPLVARCPRYLDRAADVVPFAFPPHRSPTCWGAGRGPLSIDGTDDLAMSALVPDYPLAGSVSSGACLELQGRGDEDGPSRPIEEDLQGDTAGW